jgi:cytochrome P450
MSLVRLPLPGLEFSRGLRGRRTMLEAFGRRLADKRRSSAPDLFSQLCRAESETGERFSDEEILDHLVFLMMAAHDTTTSTLTSMAYELARHPEWQERVREECFAVGEAPDFEALARLPAIDLVTNEILRRYPPLSTIPRVAVRDCEFEGYPIPEGAMVTVFPIHTHHMAEWWTAPFRFDPERFSEARAEHRRHTHVFTPFGGGAHVCLGMRFAELQIKAVLHALVRRFRWTVPQGYRMPVQQAPISKPLDGLPIFLDRLG